MEDKISVIIPIYNVESYLRECLDSVVNQTYRNLEVILIDDGSLDSCSAICDEYMAMDRRVTVIHKKNEGVSIARNVGIEKATGEWITFVDPDDWCELDYYQELISEVADRKPDVFCAGGAIWEYRQNSVPKVYAKENFYFEKRESDISWKKLPARVIDRKVVVNFFGSDYPGGFCWDKLYRADFIKRNGFKFQPALHPLEDALFNCMVFDQAERIGGSTYIGYHYRQTNLLSATKRFRPDLVQLTVSYIENLSIYQDKSQNPFLRCSINQVALSGIRGCFRNWSFYRAYGIADRVKEELFSIKHNTYIRNIIFDNNNENISIGNLPVKYILRVPGSIWLVKIYAMIDKLYLYLKSLNKKSET